MTFDGFGLLTKATKVDIASLIRRMTISFWCVVIIAQTFLIHATFVEALMTRLHFLKHIVALREIVCITITFNRHLWWCYSTNVRRKILVLDDSFSLVNYCRVLNFGNWCISWSQVHFDFYVLN